MKQRFIALICVLALATGLLAGCGKKQAETPAEENTAEEGITEEETASQESSEPKHLNAALYWFGTSLDPAVDYDGWTTVRAGVGETLVTIDENLNIVGQLADSWEMVDDTTWKMHIREGVTFHNGKQVDAAAVKASVERAMEIQERAKTAAHIAGIEAEGQEITFVTDIPFGAFLANISEPLYAIIDVESGTDPESQPIGTGPFMVTGFIKDTEIQLARYEDYWDGASEIETVTVKNISDDNTRALALQAGEIDLMQRVNETDLPLFENNSDYVVYDTQGTRIRQLKINHENEFLADARVREALACAIDYESLASVMGAGVGAAGAPYPASAPYGYDELDIQHYDAEKAAALLEEAGFADTDNNGYVEKDGKELALRLTYVDSTMTAAFEALQYMAAQVGINISLDFRENDDDVDLAGDYDLMHKNIQSLSTGDPQWLLDSYYKSDGSNNTGSYQNDEIDKICEELATTFDLEGRQALTIEAEKNILADTANIFLVVQTNYVVSNAKVHNVVPYPIDYYFLTNDITIE